jgi:hypothetical protein
MATTDKTLSQKFEQVSKELGALMNMLTRIDERVEIFIDKQEQIAEKLDDHIQNCPIKCEFPEYVARLAVVEKFVEDIYDNVDKISENVRSNVSQVSDAYQKNLDKVSSAHQENEKSMQAIRENVQKMELTSAKHESIWKNTGMFIFQIFAYVIGVSLAAGLLYLLQIPKS